MRMFRLLFSFAALAASLTSSYAEDKDQNARDVADCRGNMQKIYDAIQLYRIDHHSLPGYFNDLVPKYLSDTSVFLCPRGKRENADHPFSYLADPQLTSHYLYEFSAREMGPLWNGGKMKMAEWKALEMGLIGGSVPIIRCLLHDPALNIGFDGKFFESPATWEDLFADKVATDDLRPDRLRARTLRAFGELKQDEMAFYELQEAARVDEPLYFGDSLTSEQKESNAKVAQRALAAADRAAEFLKNYPGSSRVNEVKEAERQMVLLAARAGSSTARKQFEAMVAASESDGAMSEEEKFRIALMAIYTLPASERDLEQGARNLVTKFPKNPQSYLMLLNSCPDGSATQKRIAEEIAARSEAPDEAREAAKAVLRRLSLKGSPLEIQFTALDGREVDLVKLKGKVVLVDFWATWCQPCVAEMPNVKTAYDKLHDRGFEIIGISFDSNKSALQQFVKEKDIPWPQFFDGKGWGNQFGREYGINSIPTMWLVGKDGKIATLEARDDLERKVEELLGIDLSSAKE